MANTDSTRRREYLREYRKKNRDKAKAYADRWRSQNRYKTQSYTAKYRKKNPDKIKKYAESSKPRQKVTLRRWYTSLKHDAIEAYGGRCVCCGESAECFLTIDHAANDGAKHRQEMKANTGCGIYQWLRRHNYPQDGRFQVLCYNCNCSKQHDPIGHRAAHPNARFIDGLGENTEVVISNGRKSQKSIQKENQSSLWAQEDECRHQHSEIATQKSAE